MISHFMINIYQNDYDFYDNDKTNYFMIYIYQDDYDFYDNDKTKESLSQDYIQSTSRPPLVFSK